MPTTYFSHLAPNGQRLDHHDRPELLHGTIDFPVPKSYWAEQPRSLLDSATDNTAASLAGATDALTSTAADLLGGLQSSLGQSRGPSPAPGAKEAKEKEKERKKEERRLRKPQPLNRVFVIDVTGPSVSRGIVKEVCEAIRRGLYGSKAPVNGNEDGEEADEDIIGAGERIGIVTVAETVGFWNLSSSMSGPSLMVVSDLEDMFVPLASGFLADPAESKSQVETLLDMLPRMYEIEHQGNRVAAGSAIRGALEGLVSDSNTLTSAHHRWSDIALPLQFTYTWFRQIDCP